MTGIFILAAILAALLGWEFVRVHRERKREHRG